MAKAILDGINRLKDKLIDLTKRNKLIKYSKNKTRDLAIINESLESLYTQLVLEEKAMEFIALPDPQSDEDKELSKKDWAKKLGFSLDNIFKNSQEVQNESQIQTLHFSDEMNKILLKFLRDSRACEQEMGRNMLYLCLGFLKWKEVQYSEEYLLSPIICIPIEITKSNSSLFPNFSLRFANQNEVDINQALKEKLRVDFDIVFPEFDNYDCLEFFQKLSKIIKDREGWEIKSDIAIDFLRFEKILMYQDLRDWKGKTPLEDIEVFKDIFQGRESDGEYFSQEYEIDNPSHNELKNYPLVVDADSSQHSAIIDAVQGKNIIIEGPPGSGKSQTITNIIASFLSRKKTVLFVSEKSAALDVVYRRLKQVGLGDFCLELHSNKTKTSRVLESISNRIKKEQEKSKTLKEHISQIEAKKQEIKEYLDVLHQSYGKGEERIFRIFWKIERYHNASKILDFDIEDADYWDRDKLLKIQRELDDYEGLYQEIRQSRTNLDFWNGLDIQNFSEVEKEKIIKNILSTKENLTNICNLFASLGIEDKVSEVKNAENFFDIDFQDQGDEYSRMVVLFNKINQKITELEKEMGVKNLELGEYCQILKIVKYINTIHYDYYTKITPQMLDYDMDMQIERFKEMKKEFFQCRNDVLDFALEIDDIEQKGFDEWCNIEKIIQKNKDSLFAIFSSHYRRAKTELQGIMQEKLPKDKNKWIVFLRKIKKYFEIKEKLTQDQDFALAFGSFYKGLDTEIQQIETIHKWLKGFQESFSQNEIQNFVIRKISSSLTRSLENTMEDIQELDILTKNKRKECKWDKSFKDNLFEMKPLEIGKFLLSAWKISHSQLSDYIKQRLLANFDDILPLCEIRDELKKTKNQMKESYLDFDRFFATCHSGLQCVQKVEQVKTAKEILSRWVSFQRASLFLSSLGLSAIVDRVKMQQDDNVRFKEIFLYNFYQSLLKKAFLEFPILEKFERVAFEATIREFKQLDRELFNLNQKRIAYDAMSYPNVDYGAYLGGSAKDRRERGLIEAEIKKQKRHISLRDLIRRAPKSLQSLKPVFMMSPLSVAQYLDPEAIGFDVLIIDEASQLRPEEALGAIARSNQIIIVGDPKQLPPTDFFLNKNDDDDEEESNVASENESILDACLSIYRPIRQLRWHYRSRHEDLIRFSNSKFYDGNLVVFPSPRKNSEDELLGIGYHYIEGARYTKGSKTNILEAEKVVEYFLELIEKYPQKSIGIATFNKTQCNLIQDMIDTQELSNGLLQNYLVKWQEKEEPFFVKNLENIQGDERDIILISTTYGRDSETDKLHMRFGPINSHYGWRRLNVIFTRSKERMEIFTSMKSNEFIISEGAHRGVRDLKAFLEYAEKGFLEGLPIETEKDFDSDFEISVFNVLREFGFEVKPQVGVSGYFIDLAVESKSKNQGYILAIECDGATYHSSKSARDRDRLRQEVLERLGWSFHRIWSVDWYKNRDFEIDKLIKRVREAQIEFDSKF